MEKEYEYWIVDENDFFKDYVFSSREELNTFLELKKDEILPKKKACEGYTIEVWKGNLVSDEWFVEKVEIN